MGSYFCIVNIPGVPCREIAAFDAVDDQSAHIGLARMSSLWPGYETIALYEDSRIVSILANPSLGFVAEPLDGMPLG